MATKKRIKQPSTWAGIGAVLVSAASLPIPVLQPWFAGLGAMAGLVAVILNEGLPVPPVK